MTLVLVLNGPNLGRLGKRDPTTYGVASYDDLVTAVTAHGANRGLNVHCLQSDFEGELVQALHGAVDQGTHVVLNAGAFTHYSLAVRDAASEVTASDLLLIEVHISNIHAREAFRHRSVLTSVASGIIAGFGFDSYLAALDVISRQVNQG